MVEDDFGRGAICKGCGSLMMMGILDVFDDVYPDPSVDVTELSLSYGYCLSCFNEIVGEGGVL